MPNQRGALCVVCCGDEWYDINRGHYRCAICTRERSRRMHTAKRLAALEAYGGCCNCCGESNEAFLTIDHVNGGGTAHLRQIGHGKIFRWLAVNGYPSGFQVLCANCNMAKERPDGCPHSVDSLSTIKGTGS